MELLKHLGVMGHLLEGDLEPLGVVGRVEDEVFLEVVDGHVFPRGDFVGVDAGDVVALSDPYVVELVLGESLSDGCLVYKGIYLVHLASHPHLFPKAACSGLFQCFAITRMAATSVGPQAGRVVLR